VPLHGPRRQAPAAYAPIEAPPHPDEAGSRTAAVQGYLEHVERGGMTETARVARAWELYESPEVRFAARQYANAFSSAKLLLGRREKPWQDPVPIQEPNSKSEEKAFELLASFAGGPTGQVELLDRMGVYFVVTGDMAMVGAFDPAHIPDNKFAKWDVWSTTEIKWNGSFLTIRESAVEDAWTRQPDYVRHLRVWNRHPRRGWESDSPVLSSLKVLELIGLYDDRLQAEAISRLIGAGIQLIPQGMKLPSSTGAPGGPQDFLKLLMEVGKIAIRDRRSAAATQPILVEAAVDDIEAMAKGHIDFWSSFDEHIGDLQDRAVKRWATGVDLPAETMLGMSQATHWNASLISEDRVQSFIIPSLRRGCGNVTSGWLRPALEQFSVPDPTIELWFDPSGIKTRVDLAEEAQWAAEHFMLAEDDVKYAMGLSQMPRPTDEQIKRQMLLHMAATQPEFTPEVLRELGIPNDMPDLTRRQAISEALNQQARIGQPVQGKGKTNGRQGPQAAHETGPAPAAPGRAAELRTTRN
jgi:hypothetical protein